MIPDSIINNIRENVNIVDIIGRYVDVQKKGNNYVAICPFHDDHDPSMVINETKQFFNCFVCHTGGDVFRFVQKYENISFQESVVKVAEFAGINIEDKYKDSGNIQVLSKDQIQKNNIMNDMISYCRHELNTKIATDHKKYLINRGINTKIINTFEIGYNPKDNKVTRFLQSRNYNIEDLVKLGISNINDYGVNDFFSNRIVIPIHDVHGNPVGFTARTIDSNNQAKYINTSQTKYYNKSKLLFNYHRAIKLAKNMNNIIVCEGAMDVIGFAKADIHNVIATLGTACSDEQVKLLKILNVRVSIFYDGDKAGQDATYKLCLKTLENNIDAVVVNNQTGLDPDEIVDRYGREHLLNVTNTTISVMEFIVNYLSNNYNLENYSDKKEFVEKIQSLLPVVKDNFQIEFTKNKIKELTGFNIEDKKVIDNRYDKLIRANQNKKTEWVKKCESMIIGYMLKAKQASHIFDDKLGFLPDDDFQKLAILIIDYYRSNDYIDIPIFLTFVDDDHLNNIVCSIVQWDGINESFNDTIMLELVDELSDYLSKEKTKKIFNNIKNTSNDDEKKALLVDMIKNKRRKRG